MDCNYDLEIAWKVSIPATKAAFVHCKYRHQETAWRMTLWVQSVICIDGILMVTLIIVCN